MNPDVILQMLGGLFSPAKRTASESDLAQICLALHFGTTDLSSHGVEM